MESRPVTGARHWVTRIPTLLVLLLACDTRDRELQGHAWSDESFLTVVGRYGPTGESVAPISCAGSLTIASQTGEAIEGTFERRECAGLPRAAAVQGSFHGTVLADGTASVTFSRPPLETNEAFSTAGGCVPASDARGPYGGRIQPATIRLRTSEFVVDCCCSTRPAPGGGVMVGPRPWYSAEYRIEAVR